MIRPWIVKEASLRRASCKPGDWKVALWRDVPPRAVSLGALRRRGSGSNDVIPLSLKSVPFDIDRSQGGF